MKFLKNFCLFLGMAVVAAGFVACSDDDDNGTGSGSATKVDGVSYSTKYAFQKVEDGVVAFEFSNIDMSNPSSAAGATEFSLIAIGFYAGEGIQSLSAVPDGTYQAYVGLEYANIKDVEKNAYFYAPVIFAKNGTKYTVKIEKQKVRTTEGAEFEFEFNYSGTFKDWPFDDNEE